MKAFEGWWHRRHFIRNRDRNGDLYVRCLYWHGDRWSWYYRWLDNVFDGHCPAALRVTLFISPPHGGVFFLHARFCIRYTPTSNPNSVPHLIRPLWQGIALYAVVAAVMYGLVYYFFLGGGYELTSDLTLLRYFRKVHEKARIAMSSYKYRGVVTTSSGDFILAQLARIKISAACARRTVRSVAELGLPHGASYTEIISAALVQGLQRFTLNCVLDVCASHTYPDNDEYIIVATEKMRGWADRQWLFPVLWMAPVEARLNPSIPTHRPTLAGHSFMPRFRFSQDARFIFAQDT